MLKKGNHLKNAPFQMVLELLSRNHCQIQGDHDFDLWLIDTQNNRDLLLNWDKHSRKFEGSKTNDTRVTERKPFLNWS